MYFVIAVAVDPYKPSLFSIFIIFNLPWQSSPPVSPDNNHLITEHFETIRGCRHHKDFGSTWGYAYSQITTNEHGDFDMLSIYLRKTYRQRTSLLEQTWKVHAIWQALPRGKVPEQLRGADDRQRSLTETIDYKGNVCFVRFIQKPVRTGRRPP